MKNIKEYLLLPHIREIKSLKLNESQYLANHKIINWTENEGILTDFYTFINYNNIDEITEDTYPFFLNSIFNKRYKYDDGFLFIYEKYQDGIYAFETLNHSWDSKKLVEKLSELYDVKTVSYVNPKRQTTQFTIKFNIEIDKIIKDEKFWSLIRLYNYYIKTIINDNELILEPYKPTDITNVIYNDLEGILYHVTSKQKYIAGIKNKELAPKWKGEWDKLANKPYNIWRDGRIFFIGNNDKEKVKRQLKSISNTANIKDPIVLRVNLNKYNKLKFRIDSSAFGYDAYFTEEPIPDFCITCLDLDIFKEIDKKELI